jgi:hypothetical protein
LFPSIESTRADWSARGIPERDPHECDLRTSSYRSVLVLTGIAGSTFDTRERVKAQIERFVPGFNERILACTA